MSSFGALIKMGEPKLSHISDKGQAKMVDVSGKDETIREAIARSVLEFPSNLGVASAEELKTKKGLVVQTAIIAGTMAVKKTAELIPMCHPFQIEDIQIEIEKTGERFFEIQCRVKTSAKTGVEMEALTGASIAALTIYDMCKSISKGIVIKETELVSKSGGKSDFKK